MFYCTIKQNFKNISKYLNTNEIINLFKSVFNYNIDENYIYEIHHFVISTLAEYNFYIYYHKYICIENLEINDIPVPIYFYLTSHVKNLHIKKCYIRKIVLPDLKIHLNSLYLSNVEINANIFKNENMVNLILQNNIYIKHVKCYCNINIIEESYKFHHIIENKYITKPDNFKKIYKNPNIFFNKYLYHFLKKINKNASYDYIFNNLETFNYNNNKWSYFFKLDNLFEYFINLQELYLINNKCGFLNNIQTRFNVMQRLKILNLSCNNIQQTFQIEHPSLEELYLNDNNIKQVLLTKVPNLKVLSLKKNKSMKILYLGEHQIPPSIEYLYLNECTHLSSIICCTNLNLKIINIAKTKVDVKKILTDLCTYNDIMGEIFF